MIISFSVKNYCSISDEVTLSFEPTKESDVLSDIYFVEPIPGKKLLKLGVILGANASGKTSILRSLEIMRYMVCSPYQKKTHRIPFYSPFGFNEMKNQPTEMTLNFYAFGIRYKYFLSYNANCIVSERLMLISKGTSTIYSRTTDESNQTVHIKYGIHFVGHKDDFKQLEKTTLWNNTVLGGFLKVSIDFPQLQDVAKWFDDFLYPMIEPDTDLYGYISNLITENKIEKNNLLRYFQRADMMINDFVFKKETWDTIDDKVKMRVIENNTDKNIEEIKEKFAFWHVEFVHSDGKTSVNVDYSDESLGTQRYYQLCGVLDMLIRQKCVFFIDEIDSSLHPDLLEYLLIAFLVNSKTSQLLISTHHREWLLRKDYIRPDSIWFTEKTSDCSTHLYCLADFLPVSNFKTFNFYNAYKMGLFGAKPALGDYYFDKDEGNL